MRTVAAPQQQETASQRAKQIPGATTGEPKVDRSPIFIPRNYSKCRGPSFNFVWTAECPEQVWSAELP